VVQAKMTKISLLKSEILRMHMDLKEPTVSAIQTISDALQKWYDSLPQEMLIQKLLQENSVRDTEARRSLYYVHLLYLGTIMLMYRRIASQFGCWYRLENSRIMLSDRLDRIICTSAEQGVLAAKQSARIVKLFYDEKGVYKRCWLVM
jgi:hypothetical protein